MALNRLQPGLLSHALPDLLVKRNDLLGLPMRMGVDCQLGKEPAESLQGYSRKLREALAPARGKGADRRPDEERLRAHLDAERDTWVRPEAVPASDAKLARRPSGRQ